MSHIAAPGELMSKTKVAASSLATSAATVIGKTVPALHDAARQAQLLRDALQSDKVRLGCFLGAGCPSGVYDKDGNKGDPLIPDVARLSSHIRDQLVAHDKGMPAGEKFADCWELLVEECKDSDVIEPNVEHILTELRTLTARRGSTELPGLEKARLELLDKKICDLIVDAVGKPLPSHRCSYHRLASWVGGLERSAPVELFTPNYDLLIEEAFEQQRIPHFDGFVGSREPFFDVASIEQDAIPRRWARLWKLHGSINWQRREDGGVFRAQGRAALG
ncbi:MAG: SIR2 family protein, partial [Planctomycetota bacterium]